MDPAVEELPLELQILVICSSLPLYSIALLLLYWCGVSVPILLLFFLLVFSNKNHHQTHASCHNYCISCRFWATCQWLEFLDQEKPKSSCKSWYRKNRYDSFLPPSSPRALLEGLAVYCFLQMKYVYIWSCTGMQPMNSLAWTISSPSYQHNITDITVAIFYFILLPQP